MLKFPIEDLILVNFDHLISSSSEPKKKGSEGCALKTQQLTRRSPLEVQPLCTLQDGILLISWLLICSF